MWRMVWVERRCVENHASVGPATKGPVTTVFSVRLNLNALPTFPRPEPMSVGTWPGCAPRAPPQQDAKRVPDVDTNAAVTQLYHGPPHLGAPQRALIHQESHREGALKHVVAKLNSSLQEFLGSTRRQRCFTRQRTERLRESTRRLVLRD